MSSHPTAASRKRSRSPYARDARHDVKRHRSQSPHRKHSRHHNPAPVPLPFNAQPLHKHDFKDQQGLFARYLDVQKQIDIDDLSESEIKGRWKSFLGKWNRGELAEGWYDPEAQWRAADRWKNRPARNEQQRGAEQVARQDTPIDRDLQTRPRHNNEDGGGEDSDADSHYGPLPPTKPASLPHGATIPTLDDLQHRRELLSEAALHSRSHIHQDRKAHLVLQQARLDALAPRADPGTHQRRLEKKATQTSTLHAFREAKDGGDVDIADADMMGGGDGEDAFRNELKRRERVKSEREIRKEEVLRARMAEREERMRRVRAKEEKTMDMLRGLVRERFG